MNKKRNMKDNMKDSRSGIDQGSIQEVLDASADSKRVSNRITGQQQYSTPPEWAWVFAQQLAYRSPQTVLDPQCAGGNLLRDIDTYHGCGKFGIEIDKRFKGGDWESDDNPSLAGVHVINHSCVKVWAMFRRLYPHIKFECIVANPPFGIKWRMPDGTLKDSTEHTWDMICEGTAAGGFGYLISNQKTIEKLGIHKHPWVYLYQIIPPGMWKDVQVKIGVVHFWNQDFAGDTSPFHNQPPMVVELDEANPLLYHEATTELLLSLNTGKRRTHAAAKDVIECWQTIGSGLKEKERKYNVWLGKNGRLKAYLSTLERVERKITKDEIDRLLAIEGCHPLSLTVEVATRRTLQSLVEDGVYKVSPEATEAISEALTQANAAVTPIMPTTDFEAVGYTDEMETLECISVDDLPSHLMKLTVGKHYPLDSGTYTFTEHFTRLKQHDSKEKGVHFVKHKCSLTGQDRYIDIVDDAEIRWRFKERPNADLNADQNDRRQSKYRAYDVPDSYLWNIFRKPIIKTIKESFPDRYQKAREQLDKIVENARQDGHDFDYYEGQIDYLCRSGIKSRGLIAADVGCGKTLMALTILQMKLGVGTKFGGRALIVAPQGTVKTLEEKKRLETNDTMAQWVSEIHRFAPGVPVHRINSLEDYHRTLTAQGELPEGIYLTYYEAMFRNGAIESVTKSKSHEILCRQFGFNAGDKVPCYHFTESEMSHDMRTGFNSSKKPLKCSGTLKQLEAMGTDGPPLLGKVPDMKIGEENGHWVLTGITKVYDPDIRKGVGEESEIGITCAIEPCLATKICAKHRKPFDAVVLDEVQVMTNLKAQITKRIIRLQPTYRYALSATPIPNIVSNLFSIMGWLCVDDWYRGERRNARWPYARDEISRFDHAFLTTERDFTQEEMSNSRNKNLKVSPVISSPTRLLKLIKPTLSFVSKEMCNAEYKEAKVMDVRVPMADRQRKRYEHFLNVRNVPGENPFYRAGQQVIILRNIAADPRVTIKGEGKNAPKSISEFTPKLLACLELCRKIFERGEQVLIVSARIDQTNAVERCLTQSIGDEYISRIDSTTGARHAAKESHRFKSGKTRVMLMGIKCAAGHSFSHCPNEIILSIEFSYGPFHQAKGRVDRVNSAKRANIYVVLHKDSIEESMFDRCATKQDAATICLRGERVPRNFVPVSASEVLASHIDNYRRRDENLIEVTDEIDLEQQWDKLRGQLAGDFATGLPKLLEAPEEEAEDLGEEWAWLDDYEFVGDRVFYRPKSASKKTANIEAPAKPVETAVTTTEPKRANGNGKASPARNQCAFVEVAGTDILEFKFD